MDFKDFPHWAIKLIVLLVLFLLSMIFGAIPLKLSRDLSLQNERRSRIRNLLISLSNCFAGGVFFSTVILDLFPDVRETMEKALDLVDIKLKFPLGDFVIGFGFIMMLIIEQFVHSCCGNTWLGHHTHSHDNEYVSNFDHEDFTDIQHDFDQRDHDEHDDIDATNENSPLLVDNPEVKIQSGSKKYVSITKPEIMNHHTSDVHVDADEDHLFTRSQQSNATTATYDTIFSQNGTRHRVKRLNRTKSLASMHSLTHSNFRTFVLVFAISLHSLFEGLAVGVSSETSTLLQLVTALLIHKSIIAFSIGVQLVDADLPSLTVLICLAIFAIMCPIGIGLGIAVLQSLNKVLRLFFTAVLQGIATGTFLYVTFFEVLPHELNIEDDKKTLKILFVLIGYAAITAISYYENS